MHDIRDQRARRILTAFLITFLAARTFVFLIMTRRLPDIYIFVGQTHVHHLNFGIVLLSIVGGYLLIVPGASGQARVLSVIYGVGLGLTFDEFGMWFHLSGGYWQRASYDAVVAITGVLVLIWLAPSLKIFEVRHWTVSAVLVVLLVLFSLLLIDSLRFASHNLVPRLERLDAPNPGTK